jgi:hypothetical protein
MTERIQVRPSRSVPVLGHSYLRTGEAPYTFGPLYLSRVAVPEEGHTPLRRCRSTKP